MAVMQGLTLHMLEVYKAGADVDYYEKCSPGCSAACCT